MAFDFPNSPTIGQTYSSGGVTYKWDGQAWVGGPTADTGIFLKKAGDTATGPLLLAHAPTDPTEAASAAFTRFVTGRNMLYNSDFQISQANIGLVAAASGAQYFCDGWTLNASSALGMNAQRLGSATLAPGAIQSGRCRAQMKCTTAK